MNNEEQKEFYSARDLKRIFNIGSSNFEARVKNGDIPPCIRFGVIRRWRKSTIDEWIKNQELQHSKEVA